jgi:hypothetical protein
VEGWRELAGDEDGQSGDEDEDALLGDARALAKHY